MLRTCGFVLGGLGAVCFGMSWAVATEPDGPAEVIAGHIRQQGYRCDDPRGARRVPETPQHQVPAGARDWVVDCGNAHYRLRLIPDQGVEVEPMD